MNGTRLWVIVAVIAIVAVLSGGWFIGTQPVLASAATSALSTADVQARNSVLEMKLSALSRTAAKKAQMQAEDAVLLKAVPSILKPNTFNRRLNEVAAISGVRISDVTIGGAVAYAVPASLAAPAAAPAATPAPSASASTPAVATPAAPTAPVLAESDPLITSSNFADIPVTLTVTGTTDAILSFTTAIQDDERVLLINAISTAKNDDGTTTANLGGYIYTLSR